MTRCVPGRVFVTDGVSIDGYGLQRAEKELEIAIVLEFLAFRVRQLDSKNGQAFYDQQVLQDVEVW